MEVMDKVVVHSTTIIASGNSGKETRRGSGRGRSSSTSVKDLWRLGGEGEVSGRDE